jgi:hypothetical protein
MTADHRLAEDPAGLAAQAIDATIDSLNLALSHIEIGNTAEGLELIRSVLRVQLELRRSVP